MENRCYIRNTQERPEELTRELQANQSHFSSWESHRTSPLEVHFWAHEEVIMISQHGLTEGKSCITNPTIFYDTINRVLEETRTCHLP